VDTRTASSTGAVDRQVTSYEIGVVRQHDCISHLHPLHSRLEHPFVRKTRLYNSSASAHPGRSLWPRRLIRVARAHFQRLPKGVPQVLGLAVSAVPVNLLTIQIGAGLCLLMLLALIITTYLRPLSPVPIRSRHQRGPDRGPRVRSCAGPHGTGAARRTLRAFAPNSPLLRAVSRRRTSASKTLGRQSQALCTGTANAFSAPHG